ncbi:MAG TPA: outer membrane protein assembly factor BamD [Vicinamibacterales bacterium]|nr:outer membrane protein assembly factor BamD [Vicinamibacterales bacterium]
MAFVSTRARLSAAGWVCLAALFLGACGSAPKKPPVGAEEPDKFLFEHGTEALNRRRWYVAREFFRQLMDNYPQSPYRADAKLGLADSYLGEGSIEAQILAINEFREFLSYYPTHDRAHYAQFKLGMAHYYQMRGAGRDQTETREAIRELTVYVQKYPDKPLIDEARQRLREAKDRLGDHEFRVGLYYLRSRTSIPGALDRFHTLLKNDPEYTGRDAVYYHLAQALVLIGQPAAALPYLERLLEEFEQSEYLERARKQVDELKAALQAEIKK